MNAKEIRIFNELQNLIMKQGESGKTLIEMLMLLARMKAAYCTLIDRKKLSSQED